MIERRKGGIEPLVMIENCSRAIQIERRSELLRDLRKIDVFTIKFSAVVMERMHCANAIR